MQKDDIKDKITAYIKKMPSLPVSVDKVLQICRNAYPDPSDLNSVISLDPVLTGNLLKLINSAYYGLNTHIVSISRAIIMLGINTVKNMALSTAVFGTFPKDKNETGLNMVDFWHHSLSVGVTSKLLAVKQGVEPILAEEYFTAGLLHDIGKIPINAVKPRDYLLVISAAENGQKSLYTAENEKIGLNHCTTGDMILKTWNIEGAIADVVMYHHDTSGYSGMYSNVVNNVAIANYFSCINEIGFAGNRIPDKPDSKIWEAAGLDDSIFDEIREKVNHEIKKARIFLDIHDI